MTPEKVAALKARFEAAGQSHVFAFWEQLSEAEKTGLYSQLSSIDPKYCNDIFAKATGAGTDGDTALAPLPESVVASVVGAGDGEQAKSWHAQGMALIAKGQVGVILMAGGQGTRLGSSAPKGCYNIGLPSAKSLFQLQAERILRLQVLASKLAGGKEVVIPWYIMKLGPATPEYFEEHKFFGLKKGNVFFFEQGTLPAFDMTGKILLEAKDKVSVAPDGNGGIYRALRLSGVLGDMSKRGIKYLHAYCVDNCLVKVADPAFIGYCASKNVECGAKVVRKEDPKESVGVICLKNGKAAVVEYSEIDPKVAALTKPDGTLVYAAANIANHYYTIEFLQRVQSFETALDYHVAKKKIKHVTIPAGNLITPTSNNGIKLELFVFDVFPLLDLFKFAVLESARSEDFSPLKNATGPDSPETSRNDILALHRKWIEASGATVEKGVIVELSSVLTYGGEDLEAVKGKTVVKSGHADTLKELQKLLA